MSSCAGIGYSDDHLLQTRIFSYPDTQRHRLGPNYLLLPANAPKCAYHNNHHDGFMNFTQRDEEVLPLLLFPCCCGPLTLGLRPKRAPLPWRGCTPEAIFLSSFAFMWTSSWGKVSFLIFFPMPMFGNGHVVCSDHERIHCLPPVDAYPFSGKRRACLLSSCGKKGR